MKPANFRYKVELFSYLCIPHTVVIIKIFISMLSKIKTIGQNNLCFCYAKNRVFVMRKINYFEKFYDIDYQEIFFALSSVKIKKNVI